MKREILDETGIETFVKEAVGFRADSTDRIGVKSSVHEDGPGRSLPRICSNGRQLRDISNDALEALQGANEPPELFVRSGMMVAIVRNEKQRQVISEVGVDALCGRLARCADYFRVSASGVEYNCPPPPGVVKDILALAPGEWKFQSLDAVTEVPIIRPDGSIPDVPGYVSATRLYYTPDPNRHLPTLVATPSTDHIKIALDLIDKPSASSPTRTQPATRTRLRQC